jgi:hypothetical protein
LIEKVDVRIGKNSGRINEMMEKFLESKAVL